MNVLRPESETKLTTVGQTYISPGKTAQIEFNATDSYERTGFQLKFKAGETNVVPKLKLPLFQKSGYAIFNWSVMIVENSLSNEYVLGLCLGLTKPTAKAQGGQSHHIKDVLRYFLCRLTTMGNAMRLQAGTEDPIFFAIIQIFSM